MSGTIGVGQLGWGVWGAGETGGEGIGAGLSGTGEVGVGTMEGFESGTGDIGASGPVPGAGAGLVVVIVAPTRLIDAACRNMKSPTSACTAPEFTGGAT